MRTHTLPPYPPISVRLNEQGTTLMEVHITTEGNVDDCKVIQDVQFGSSRSGGLRIRQKPLALAAAHQSGHPDRCFNSRLGQMGPERRQVISTPSLQFIDYHGVEK